MADFEGQEIGGVDSHVSNPIEILTSAAPPGVFSLKQVLLDPLIGGPFSAGVPATLPASSFEGQEAKDPGQFFFERVWTSPSSIELGSIITTVTRAIEIYNSYRNAARTFTSATPNAGPGVTFDGLPSLPAILAAQAGAVFDVVISASGPPDIDGTLDFVLDSGAIAIPITGSRVIMFPYEPETPIQEVLRFQTDILKARDNSEQRVSMGKHPRQEFELVFRLEEGSDRRTFHMLMAGAQAGVLGLPVWFESRKLGADITALDTTITVDTTFADFRVGALAIIWSAASTFESLEIQSLTATSITFTSAVSNSYGTDDTIVAPLRLTRTEGTASGQKYIKNMDEYRMKFIVMDNDVDLSDTSAWGSFNSKVMLSDPNWVGDSPTITESISTRIEVIDNEITGRVQYTDDVLSALSSTKGFIANTPEAVWRIRQLAHALRGSHTSFYIPTFYTDIINTSTLGAGSNQMVIENIGYTDFVNGQDPLAALWMLLNDGTVITRLITVAEELTSTTERLTVDSVWGQEILVEDIDRISFLRLARIANDELRITHLRPGTARAVMSIVGVQQ
jgi:hypothetical protein